MTAEELKSLALECGFTLANDLHPSTLRFMPEVRQMCAANTCHAFDKTWSCPPACGSIEDWAERASHYSEGILLQTVGDREDSWDFESMMDVADANKKQFEAFIKAVNASGMDYLAFSAGSCTRCKPCTYPDAPCRFPDEMKPSMEAAGLFVSDVCTRNGTKYNYGDLKIAYTCCILFN